MITHKEDYDIALGLTLFVISFETDDEQIEIERWLAENIKADDYSSADFSILFNEKEDALAFKLRWI